MGDGQDQLGRMAILSGLLFVMLALGTDGVPPVMQARRPLAMAEGLPRLPAALSGYKYVLLKLGPFQLTRKGVSLAAAASCLSFTVSIIKSKIRIPLWKCSPFTLSDSLIVWKGQGRLVILLCIFEGLFFLKVLFL